MTYADISEIKVFNDLIQLKRLSTGQIALWYALLYINNKCPSQSWFTVTNLTLQLQTGLSREGINKARNVLKQSGLIDFKADGTKATAYKLNKLTMPESSQVSTQVSGQVSCQVSTQVSSQVSTQVSTTLNKLNKTKLEIKEKNIKKEKYGSLENVALTAEEFEKLKAEYPDYEERIERLSLYIGSKGDKYKSHYATIKNWARKDGVTTKPKPKDVFALE